MLGYAIGMAETREIKEIFIRKSEGRREVVRYSA
jgi:hypothetical protein